MSLKEDEEFENFVRKAEDIGSIIQGMRSKDPEVAEKASRRADIYLKSEKGISSDLNDDEIKVKTNKTVINKKAFEEMEDKISGNEMSKEIFMAEMEKDAVQRQRDRQRRKAMSDSYKKKGNDAFRKQDYETALISYNKAIDEVKDSCVLYTNRALTSLKLGLYSRAVQDCEWALKINENNLKGWLYKAQAYYCQGETKKAEECIQEALKRFPKQHEFIQDCKLEWAKEEES